MTFGEFKTAKPDFDDKDVDLDPNFMASLALHRWKWSHSRSSNNYKSKIQFFTQ